MDDSKKVVVITRVFPAGINRLWKAFTDPQDMLRWHSPVGMTTPHVELDFKIGGKYAISMQYDDTKEIVTVRGVYEEIKKPTRLGYSWKWDGSEEETHVLVEFHEVSKNQTRVVLTHAGFSLTPEEVDVKNNWTHASHKAGWTTAFEKLEKLVLI